MTVLDVAVVTSGSLLVLIVAGWLLFRRAGRAADRAVRSRLRTRLIVTLKSGDAFDGVLWEADGRVWVLRQANAHGAGGQGEDLTVDGEVLLMVADIQYAQRP